MSLVVEATLSCEGLDIEEESTHASTAGSQRMEVLLSPISSNETPAHEENNSSLLGSKNSFRSSSRTPLIQLVVLSVAYMLGFSPLAALLNLEGILNPEIGHYALMGNYGGAIFSFVTAPVIGRFLGAKGSILLGWSGQLVLIAVHFYVKAYILIPVAFCVGVLHAQTMIAAGVFVTTFALQYAEITKNQRHTVMGMFNGMFYAIFSFETVWSNIVSSLILNQPVVTYFNATGLPNPLNLSQLCGPAFCPWEDTSGTYIRQPEQYIVYILLGCFLAMSGTAFLITLCLVKNIHPSSGDAMHGSKDFFFAIGHLLFKKKLIFLIPLFVVTAVEEEFIFTEFTKAFVSCEIGIHYNGWVMLAYVAGQLVGNLAAGRLVKHLGWPIMYILAFLCNCACLTSMLLLDPMNRSTEFYFLIPVAWGFSDSVWMTQSSAYVGHVFPNDKWPAFVAVRAAIYIAWGSLYATTNFICMNDKIYIAFGVMGFAMCSFGMFEFLHRGEKKKEIQAGRN
ncbi:protein unc-93 homolog A-like [Lingula anatina]|uniref:Protein unc-93 homolog A-like n=1 Tax=Lingula anatina TaxID=7574 RepID=A0A1S3HY64_LINAN|nr:protein unc-93 homolog A-like [Lingula anatina]|eukprot:XP_013390506.1 protein unc-93 homolog A-like [Lingula anatina]